MQPLSLVLAVVIGGVILFLWTGFTQNVLPWGIKSVKEHPAGDGLGEAIAQVEQNGMRYVKDRVAAFVAIKPEAYYAIPRYFGIEFVTQLLTAAALAGILALTAPLPDAQRLLIAGLVGAAGIFSIDLQYWNWWGFSNIYTLGVAVNRLVGYLLAAFVMVTWLL